MSTDAGGGARGAGGGARANWGEWLRARPWVVAVGVLGGIAAAVGQVAGLPATLGDAWRDAFGPAVVITTLVDVEDRPSEFLAGPQDWEPFDYFFARPPAAVDPPPDQCRDRRAWATAEGGADTTETWVVVTVENAADTTVSFGELSVEVERAVDTPDGFVAACPTGGASIEPSGLLVDLGAESLRYVEPPSPTSTNEARTAPRFSLAPGEQEVLTVRAAARAGQVVDWRLVGRSVSEGEAEPFVIQDGDAPFRTVGAESAPRLVWEGRWLPAPG